MLVFSYIGQVGNKWRVYSRTGKNLGTCDTKEEAEKRLAEVEMFKHMKKKRKRRAMIMAALIKIYGSQCE